MKLKFFVILLLMATFIACDSYSPPQVVVTEQEKSFNDQGQLVLKVTVRNDGRAAAYFVIVQVKALVDGEEVEYHEKDVGDLFPSGSITEEFTFKKFVLTSPDEFDIDIVYTQDTGEYPLN